VSTRTNGPAGSPATGSPSSASPATSSARRAAIVCAWARLCSRAASLTQATIAASAGVTFPGLGPDWVRIAVRDEATTEHLLTSLAAVLAGAR
jgi:hypothetical protein